MGGNNLGCNHDPSLRFWVTEDHSRSFPPKAVFGLAATLGVLLMDPFGRELRASVFHDRLYEERHHKFFADAAYRIIMASDGVNLLRRILNYWGVFFFGWFAWLMPAKKQEGSE